MGFPNVGPDIEQRREEAHLAAQDSMNEKDLQVKEPKKETEIQSSTLTMQAREKQPHGRDYYSCR